MPDCPWYVTIAALRQWKALAGYRGEPEEENPDYRRAEAELLDLLSRGVQRDTGVRTESGAEIWRTGRLRVGRRREPVRLELTVMPGRRPEGPKPQLLRVRAKTSSRGRA